METDLTLTVTSALTGCTFLGVVIFFIIIFYQEIQEFKDKPLPKTVTKNDPELRSISMSPLSKMEKERRTSSPIPAKNAEIILTPKNLAIDMAGSDEIGSRRSIVVDSSYMYTQGFTNEAFNESEVI